MTFRGDIYVSGMFLIVVDVIVVIGIRKYSKKFSLQLYYAAACLLMMSSRRYDCRVIFAAFA